MTAPKRLPRAVREQQMLDAAVRVFGDTGYRQTAMDSVAKVAQISKPMLYLYYGSKEELFAACVRRESQRFIESISVGLIPGKSPREQLTLVIESLLRFVAENPASWTVIYQEAAEEPALSREVGIDRDRFVELVAKLLKDSFTHELPEQYFLLLATALVGAGEAVADMVAAGGVDIDAATHLIIGLAWRGLSGAEPLA